MLETRPSLGQMSIAIASQDFGGSSNGRTADSDSASLGSNPSPPAILRRAKLYLTLGQLGTDLRSKR